MTDMYYIHHIGHGPLTNHGEDDPLTFKSEAEALQYLADCGEVDNVGTEWEVRPLH